VSPIPFAGSSEGGEPDPQALRLWHLWRETLHLRYQELGVAVTEWTGNESLARVVEEVGAFRRFAR
jgi:hypothetical protein